MKKLALGVTAIAGFAFATTNCLTCHNGSMAKKLDTLTPKEITAKMKEYKAGKGNSTMVSIVKGMSDKEIAEVAQKYGKATADKKSKK